MKHKTLELLSNVIRDNQDIITTLQSVVKTDDENEIIMALESVVDVVTTSLSKLPISKNRKSMQMIAKSFSLESDMSTATGMRSAAANAFISVGTVLDNSFAKVWFPAMVMGNPKDEMILSVNVPKLIGNPNRKGTGAEAGQVVDFGKQSVIDAVVDSPLLEPFTTDVVPYASDATNPVVLVPQSVVSDIVVSIDGNDINTRPILLDTSVDLISLSSSPLLIDGNYSELDNLDPVINIGTVYAEVKVVTDIGGTNTTVSAVVAFDVSAQYTSYFSKRIDGTSNQMVLNLDVSLSVGNDLTVVGGPSTAAALITAIEGLLGLAVDAPFVISADLILSGVVDLETAIMNVSSGGTYLVDANDRDRVEIDIAGLDTGTELFTITPIGYIPKARRSLDLITNKGVLVSVDEEISFRYPIVAAVPLISKSSVLDTTDGDVERLINVNNIRNSNLCATAIMELEQQLQKDDGNLAGRLTIGSNLVTPTLVTSKTLDISAIVNVVDVAKSLWDVRENLIAYITNVVNLLLNRSRYISALEAMHGNAAEFEILILTEPAIASHLFISGDGNTLGILRSVVITQSTNKLFAGKVYISFRRKDRADPSPLDFGLTVMAPGTVRDTTVSTESGFLNKLHFEPNNSSYVTLPCLGVINVTNMNDLLTL